MQTVIDLMKDQLHKQQLPLASYQKQWLEAMEMLMETEMSALRTYWEAWFNLSKTCLVGQDAQNPLDLGHGCADMFCAFNKALLEHHHQRQKIAQDWRERITEIMY
ncbi:hypothetical protein [Marinospirillum sp.]|uniref:hypothetical protein n=1 Tax=Marinospirillum sp. TaxID=2183934 RepID=UPI003A83691D